MSVTAVLVLWLCCWSLSLADDDAAAALNDDLALADGDTGLSHDVATLLDKMNNLELRVSKRDSFLLSEHDHLKSKLLHKESLNQDLRAKLLRHEDTLTQQQSLNQDLTAKLLRHEDTLTQQQSLNQDLTAKLLRHEDTLTQQQSLNRELANRLARQDGMLLMQGRLIQQLRSATVSRASATVSRASATASLTSVREATAPVFRPHNVDDVEDTPGSDTKDSGDGSAVSGRNVTKRSVSDSAGHNVTKRSAAASGGHNVAKRPDSARNVAKRSDDGGPLEAVVNQISQRVTEMGAALQALQNSDRQQETALQDARTSTFVRWGSSTCTSSSSLVYSGVVGGSSRSHSGAATNFLCLTQSPVFSQRSTPAWKAYLYGAEYDTGDSQQDKDPLCAVCRAAFSTTVMLPGTDTCSPGWHLNYSGFLMAGGYDHTGGSEYICVDPAMESAPHGDANEDGRMLDYTVTHCGSLPCGPYVNNKVVTCAVCSK